MDLRETDKDVGAEGEDSENSQAKGSDSDGTLESEDAPTGQAGFRRISQVKRQRQMIQLMLCDLALFLSYGKCCSLYAAMEAKKKRSQKKEGMQYGSENAAL